MVEPGVERVHTDGVDAEALELLNVTGADVDIGERVGILSLTSGLVGDAANVESLAIGPESCIVVSWPDGGERCDQGWLDIPLPSMETTGSERLVLEAESRVVREAFSAATALPARARAEAATDNLMVAGGSGWLRMRAMDLFVTGSERVTEKTQDADYKANQDN